MAKTFDGSGSLNVRMCLFWGFILIFNLQLVKLIFLSVGLTSPCALGYFDGHSLVFSDVLY